MRITALTWTEDGKIDLDQLYASACTMTPSIAEKMYERRIAAANKQSREQADRARRSSASLAPGAPGRGSAGSTTKPRGRTSVRESIEQALAESRGGSRI